MAQNICINGESACHAGSDGKLTTSDTCMTPPYCIPITYTNIAESKVADQTVSSVKIQGNPACNQKSIFKISQGDSPGCCGGVSSGSVGQMTKFLEGSSNVIIGGEPAVFNGLLKVSNAENTDPKPLIQPPADKAPANTTEAPATTGEFSQQFDFSNLIGTAPGDTKILERPTYEIWTKEGERLGWGNLNSQGLTERVYTPEKTNLIAWLGDGNWKVFSEYDHGPYESAEENTKDTATLRFGLVNFARAAIPELDYKLLVNGKETTGKTDETGCTQALEGISPGATVDISVLREKDQTYKKIATVTADAGEAHHTLVSAKVKIESATEKHKGEAAAPKAKTSTPAANKTDAKPVPQKPATETSRDKNGNPLAMLLETNLTMLLFKGILKSYMYWTSFAFGKANAATEATQGHPKLDPTSFASAAGEGTPLSPANLTKLQGLVKFTEKHVQFDYRGCGAKDKNDVFVRSTQAVIDKYTDTLIGDPDFSYTDSKGDHDGSKDATGAKAFIGLCLAYVKVALRQSEYINGLPGQGQAKNSGIDWINPIFGYKEVGSNLPKVVVTYNQACAEEDIPKAEKTLQKKARLKQLNNDKVKLNAKLHTAAKAKDTTKIEAAKTAIAAKEGEIKAAESELADAIKDEPARTTVTYPQPDLMYTLPGDLIVYEKVDPVELNAAGHIDIRTYHGFYSDAAWAVIPSLGRPPSKSSRYKVTGVYRKISDTMAMVRVQAFLRIIREHEAKGYKDPYLADHFDGKEHLTFSDMTTHPSNAREDKPAGAYQIRYTTWRDVCIATGWPKTFDSDMQDRIAIYLLQERPLETMPHPRRSALGYIMEDEIEKAVNETGLWNLFAFLPGGGKQQQMTMPELTAVFDKYVGEAKK